MLAPMAFTRQLELQFFSQAEKYSQFIDPSGMHITSRELNPDHLAQSMSTIVRATWSSFSAKRLFGTFRRQGELSERRIIINPYDGCFSTA